MTQERPVAHLQHGLQMPTRSPRGPMPAQRAQRGKRCPHTPETVSVVKTWPDTRTGPHGPEASRGQSRGQGKHAQKRGQSSAASTTSAIRTRSGGRTKVHSKEERQGSDTLKWLPQKISTSSGQLENSGGDGSCCKALPTRIYGRKSDITEIFHPARRTYWV